ncbi:hypothetical protein Q5P01_021992 [Channa striata]|uniref:Selenoprotein P N-terminal domain-containing protein n=1 Tax=Channa striata TaxID=64152 RepID=A0AA88JC28_CHASR|nr:hypothetical protein Q5P01_021992 [Channa striata]
MYWELKRRAPPGVPVYQQAALQDDVWEALDGDKDDFLVYDRCGLLTFHIVLPYSFLQYPYVEAAIRATYHKDICNCTTNFTLSSGRSGSGLSNMSNTTLSSLEPDPDYAEEGDTAPQTHHHVHNHYYHHYDHHQHNSTNTSHGNETQQDTSQKKAADPVPHTHRDHTQSHLQHEHY